MARRIFSVFLLCALLPFGGLVAVSYYQVGDYFDRRSERQLHDLAKLFGLDVHERLTLLRASLEVIASAIRNPPGVSDYRKLEAMAAGQGDRLEALEIVTPSGRRYGLLGRLDAALAPAASVEHPPPGRALISVVPVPGDPAPRILMRVAIDPATRGGRVLVGEVKPSYLWGVDETRLMPSYVEVCVRDQTGLSLRCPAEVLAALPGSLRDEMRGAAVGDRTWSHGGRQYLASYWTIPMEYEFGTPGWVIALKASKDGVFASIAELERTFLLATLGCTGLAILLAMVQIRRRLVPLEKLKEGTERIARQDFATRIETESDDEFAALADAVNSMASQLGQQFSALAMKSEIDRTVLSLLDTEKVVETILSRFGTLFRCPTSSLTLIADQKPPREYVMNHGALALEASGERTKLVCRIAAVDAPCVLDDAEQIAALAPALTQRGTRAIMAGPLAAQGKVLAVLCFYATDANCFRPQDLQLLGELLPQAALAILNSQLFESTRRYAAELEFAGRAKDNFLAVMSHELRTPLNVILGYVSLLEDKTLGALNPGQATALATVAKHSRQLLDLVNSVLQATLIQAGQVVVNKQAVNVVETLDRLQTKWSAPADKPVALSWSYPTALPLISADEEKLVRILDNLIDNAIKFTPAGEVAISVRLAAGSVEFAVADTGIGIPSENHDAIFELFRQGDDSRTREFGGLGLGLFIAKRFAEMHGGTIRVESTVGRGSTFRLALPLVSSPERRVNDAAPAPETV